MIAALACAAVLNGPTPIPVGDGFLMPTQYRTIARYQLALTSDQEFAKLMRIARDNSLRRPPRTLRVLQVIVREIDAPIEDKEGNKVQAVSVMSSAEINRCREWFDDFANLVFAYTAGALQVEQSELLIEHKVKALDSMGERKYWMSAANAMEGIQKSVKTDYYDSVCFYYKKPENMQAGLLGGALGRDYGVNGSAFWTQWITDWNEPPSPLASAAVVSVHEWLHNISYYAHRVMAYKAVPDCHAAEEYGYWDADGGYKQWQAWNRDLMLRLIPREFWYRLDTRSDQIEENAPPINKDVKPGSFYSWRDVGADWHARLPALTDADLQEITGCGDLKLETYQFAANTHSVFRLQTAAKSQSAKYGGDLKSAPAQFDNVLALTRRPTPSKKDDPNGGYADAMIEGLAILRIEGAPKDRRDLILIRPDIAPYVLGMLRVYNRRGNDSVIGFIHRQDPSEKQQLTLIAALVDFGEKLPADELAAIGR
ncbi:MAG: hypothetical protein ABIV13_00465 [Fimbriimonadales bacterium]